MQRAIRMIRVKTKTPAKERRALDANAVDVWRITATRSGLYR